MKLYLESSALLRDLLDGDGADDVRERLRGAELVLISRLTLAEVGRVLARLRAADPAAAARVAPREAELERDAERWAIHPVDDAIWTRCARPFPVEPVRTLDAVHLATIEVLASAMVPLQVLSYDARIRVNVTALGLGLLP